LPELINSGNRLEKARQLASKDRLRQIWSALNAYRAQHGALPNSLSALVTEGRLPTHTLQCPTAIHLGMEDSAYVLVGGINEHNAVVIEPDFRIAQKASRLPSNRMAARIVL
jgi:type II secretory pathway pseudopilin PulG